MSVIRPFSDVDLHAFVDDQVSAERRNMIASYLKSAPAEAARVDGWRRQNEALRSVFAGTAAEPVPLWLTIKEVASSRERQEFGADRSVYGSERAARSPWRGLLERELTLPLVTALAVILAFAAGLAAPRLMPQWVAAIEDWLPGSPRAAALQAFAARTLDAHRIYGIDPDRPAEMPNAGQGDLEAWFRRHVTFPLRIPDLHAIGWTLKGGRVVPGEVGAAALLVYEDAVGDRLSLTIGRIGNPAPFDTSYTITAGPALVWMDGPLAFGVATSLEGAWLSDHARMLYRAVYASRSD